MKRFKCITEYDGAGFSGFQIQPKKRTIQGEIERALMTIHKRKRVRIHASGRTDTGVHAKRQVFHFDSQLNLLEEDWKRALNALLPKDIYICQVVEVSPSFHSRFDAIEKEYRYFVLNTKECDVFKRNYAYYTSLTFNIEMIQQACQLFQGKHDFTSFCSSRSTVKGDKVRTLYEVTCMKNGDMIEFRLRGDGFLYNMVRIIIGTLLDVGLGKISLHDIKQMFESKDRTVVGRTMPPEGLYLWNVIYNS